jgi:two-component system chemotaxis response regulator CheB
VTHSLADEDPACADPPVRAAFRIIAIAASAGGLKALSQVLSQLPANFAVPIMVVQHLDPKHQSLMAEILSRRTPLSVKQAEQGEIIQAGEIYIAPPNYHVTVAPDGKLTLNQSALMNFVRPCADVLFTSVAISYPNQAIAIVLTGTGKDGAAGIEAIQQSGGMVIVQDSATAEFSGMPNAAIRTGAVDRILPLADIAPVLVTAVMGGKGE